MIIALYYSWTAFLYCTERFRYKFCETTDILLLRVFQYWTELSHFQNAPIWSSSSSSAAQYVINARRIPVYCSPVNITSLSNPIMQRSARAHPGFLSPWNTLLQSKPKHPGTPARKLTHAQPWQGLCHGYPFGRTFGPHLGPVHSYGYEQIQSFYFIVHRSEIRRLQKKVELHILEIKESPPPSNTDFFRSSFRLRASLIITPTTYGQCALSQPRTQKVVPSDEHEVWDQFFEFKPLHDLEYRKKAVLDDIESSPCDVYRYRPVRNRKRRKT